jgi:hypothetical protein
VCSPLPTTSLRGRLVGHPGHAEGFAREGLQEFFRATNALEHGKKLEFLGWQGPARAKKLITRLFK